MSLQHEDVHSLTPHYFRAGAAPPPEESTRSLVFSGGGHTLGSDEVESQFIPDPNGPAGTFIAFRLSRPALQIVRHRA